MNRLISIAVPDAILPPPSMESCLFRWRYWEPMTDLTCRLFLCARCRKQVFICRRCDRGQIYCADGCAKISRNQSVREAGRRYQQSRQGRFKQAERLRRFRRRKQNVTHQGSELASENDLLNSNSTMVETPVVTRHVSTIQCHFCGTRCSEFVRNSFLHRRRVPIFVQLKQRGTPRGHSP